MYIGWIQELFDVWKERYSNQEVIEFTNEAINDLRKYSSDCINTLEEAKKDFAEEQQICPNCGYNEFEVKKTLENTDADGKRGVWLDTYICKGCGEELNS
jgi:hypothetical protein